MFKKALVFIRNVGEIIIIIGGVVAVFLISCIMMHDVCSSDMSTICGFMCGQETVKEVKVGD